MAALELPGFDVRRGRRSVSLRGRWSLATGGVVQVRTRRDPWPPRLGRGRVSTLPLVSGALVIGDPVHLTVGEVAVAVDKTRTVRLTVAEVTALGNRRVAVDLIVSALGDDAGPDETARLEGYIERERGGALRVVLSGAAPAGFGGAASRIRLSAAFDR